MSVDEWARREAEREASLYVPVAAPFVLAAVQDSLLRAFDALLSDEAVEAAATVMADSEDTGSTDCARRALQAAVEAVTEGATSGR